MLNVDFLQIFYGIKIKNQKTCKKSNSKHNEILYIYIYEGYEQQPIAITQCFMGWTQSSDASTIQYLSVLKSVTEY